MKEVIDRKNSHFRSSSSSTLQNRFQLMNDLERLSKHVKVESLKKLELSLTNQQISSKMFTGYPRRKLFKLPVMNAQLLHKKVRLRPLSSIKRSLKYAANSQLGRVRGITKKFNQDAYSADLNSPNLFGVYDGHGTSGHHVSSYLREKLPTHIKHFLQHRTSSYKPVLSEAFASVNSDLIATLSVHLSYSGSTATVVLIDKEHCVCANVGDSSALLIHKSVYDWSFKELTTDHKPNASCEKARILACGGLVEPAKLATGEFAGPYRVWLPETQAPGLAMSRAFGDKVASEIGVIAEPDIKEIALETSDKFLILATDGLWDSFSFQECASFVGTLFEQKNSLETICNKLIAKAARHQGFNCDDITVVLVSLNLDS